MTLDMVQDIQLYPTHIVRTDCSDFFTSEDHELMKESTDLLIENGRYTDNDLTPKYQTETILFLDDAPDIWKKLRESFYKACHNYLSTVTNFCPNQKNLKFSGCNAWVYKGWKGLNQYEKNPWHHHNPAFLSGVYYIQIPPDASGDKSSGGTEFTDPRCPEGQVMQNQMVAPQEYTWVIFPGWLTHRSNLVNSDIPRYVIAANMFVMI